MNPEVNYGLWMIMRCHCRFILGNKCTTLVSDADLGGSYTCVGVGVYIWKSSVPSFQFFCETKTALKKVQSLKRKTT